MPSILHVGCGSEPLPAWLDASSEVRLDIEPAVNPDIVASMTDLGEIGPFDAVYSSHSLEHLMPYDVPVALGEFRRVLAEGGVAIIFVPDLQDVKPTADIVYQSPAGPICGLDMIYGLHSALAERPYMAHRCGFVAETLTSAIEAAGFSKVEVIRQDGFQLMAVATK